MPHDQQQNEVSGSAPTGARSEGVTRVCQAAHLLTTYSLLT